MEFRKKSLKNFFGLVGFSVVIVLSFFIISDIEKTYTLWYSTELVSAAVEETPMPPALSAPPVQALLQAPRPPAVVEPLPRVNILDAEYHLASKGYPLTAFVEFGEGQLRFHMAEGVDVGLAQLTIVSIMEVFDAAYELFPGGYFYDYFLVADCGNIPNRRISYSFAEAPCRVAIVYLYFARQHPLPMWLCMGLENYIMGGGNASPLSNEDLAMWLGQGAGVASFGDAWLVPLMGPRDITQDDMRNAAYTLVRQWSQAGELYDIVRLAQGDMRAFAAYFGAYTERLVGSDAGSDLYFLYRFGSFEVITALGNYVFVNDSHVWTWATVSSYVGYMDAAIEFVRYRFLISNTDSVRVTLYPFDVANIPDAIAEMAYMFEWDALDVNFVSGDEVTLVNVSRFGPWAISHEVAHILLFREFGWHRPSAWLCEGMAMLGEMLFRDDFEGARPYRFTVPLLTNIDAMSRGGRGHILPFLGDDTTFGRDSWTYDDAGSFVLYLYNGYGIEALLEMFRSDSYSQLDMAVEIFGRELDELMYNWREFLWPNGEPAGWWGR